MFRDEKMSKSLGNVKLIHDLLKDWDGEVIRLALLKAHYRSELVWTEDLLKESKAQLDGWYRILEITEQYRTNKYAVDSVFSKLINNDLNTILAIKDLENTRHLLATETIWKKDKDDILKPFDTANQDMVAMRSHFIGNANLLGLLQKDPDEWFKGGLDYDALVAEYDSVRAQALSAKETGDKAKMGEMFKRSDEIRDQFKAEGVVIESGAGGKSSWRKA